MMLLKFRGCRKKLKSHKKLSRNYSRALKKTQRDLRGSCAASLKMVTRRIGSSII
jgi:hypothetical protein